ncbi:O-acetyl-ADP-ribose deacetylase [Virgibacillus sp. SK37]|uniref:O-acetyl-ADP-ribose deacetylase n=1 Tax=Virgibacillus sp. SK37 TaxID=403957 RepID=UPI0004D0BED1|nr:O-acetyl-ADP-ribose deacetylase [Virgibacillus sp. SK37]AIF44858.1 hypothetical protein X953_18395 [Virgibacillus sp. SK37]
MDVTIGQNGLKLMVGDITMQRTDAIVNAANGTLLGGGGVDGAIHRAAGDELLQACKRVREKELSKKELPTGEAVITRGYNLAAGYVIHTVGPVWQGGTANEPELLASCYQNGMQLALQHKLTSISFPSISTGVYRFPIELAADIALGTLVAFLKEHHFGQVVIVLFSEADYDVYTSSLKKIIDEKGGTPNETHL